MRSRILISVIGSMVLMAVAGCGSTIKMTMMMRVADDYLLAAPTPSGSVTRVAIQASALEAQASGTPTAPIETATPTSRQIFAAPIKSPLAWAQLMVQHVPLSNTAYEHRDTVVTWAGVNNASDYSSYADCSGFMNALLAQADGLSIDDFENWGEGLSHPIGLARDQAYYPWPLAP
jgi:hypothetical protein